MGIIGAGRRKCSEKSTAQTSNHVRFHNTRRRAVDTMPDRLQLFDQNANAARFGHCRTASRRFAVKFLCKRKKMVPLCGRGLIFRFVFRYPRHPKTDMCTWDAVGMWQTSTQTHRCRFVSWATIIAICRPKSSWRLCDFCFRTGSRDVCSRQTTSWSHTIRHEQREVRAAMCTAKSSNGPDGTRVASRITLAHRVTRNCFPSNERLIYTYTHKCTLKFACAKDKKQCSYD